MLIYLMCVAKQRKPMLFAPLAARHGQFRYRWPYCYICLWMNLPKLENILHSCQLPAMDHTCTLKLYEYCKKKKLYCTTKCIYCCAQTCFFFLSYNISHCFEILKIKRSTFPKCFIFNSDVLLHLSAKITINTDSLKRGRNVWDCYHNKKQWWPRCIWWALFWAPRVPFIGLGEIKLNVMIDRIFNLYQSKHDITPDCPFSGANFFLLSKRF